MQKPSATADHIIVEWEIEDLGHGFPPRLTPVSQINRCRPKWGQNRQPQKTDASTSPENLVMPAILERPMMAIRIQLSESCRTIPPHAPRRIKFGDPGELRSGRNIAEK